MSCGGKECHSTDPHCIYPECQAVSWWSTTATYGAAILLGILLAVALIGVFHLVA